MGKSKQEIIDEIVEHIQGRGGEYAEWYVGTGLALEARKRLFKSHHVREKGDRWIHRRADSAQAAREIEGYFVSTLTTDGKPNPANETADTVYAYKKAAHTTP